MSNYRSYTRKCSNCGNEFAATRWDASLCSSTCRKAWSRIPEKLDAAYMRAAQAIEEINTIKQQRRDLGDKCAAMLVNIQKLAN